MKNTLAILLSTFLLSHAALAAIETKEPTRKTPCLATKEYITTLNFLRSEKTFELGEADAQKIADQVSSGCENAAKNFIQSVLAMVEAGVPTKEAVKTAVEVSKYDSKIRNHFLEVFNIAYPQDQLDLDVETSLSLAKSLSLEFKGDTDRGVKDFKQALSYCLERSNLDLPRPECARIAKNLALIGEQFDRETFQDFKKLDQFIRGNKFDMSVAKSTQLTLEVLALAPAAAENFMSAYKFATSEGGLKLPFDAAIAFSKKLAAK